MLKEDIIFPVVDQEAALAFHHLIDLGAGVRRHHREVGNHGIKFNGKVNRTLHGFPCITGQTNDEKANRLQPHFFRILKGLADGLHVDLFVNALHDLQVAGFHTKGGALEPGRFEQREQFFAGQIGANPVDKDPRHMIEVVFNQQVCDFFQPFNTNVGAVVENADFLSIKIFDEMTPLSEDTLRAAAAPLDRHNALAAEGTAIRTTTAGHNAKTARPINVIGRRLEVGVAIHLKKVVRRPR